jgi:hypothetical protein
LANVAGLLGGSEKTGVDGLIPSPATTQACDLEQILRWTT